MASVRLLPIDSARCGARVWKTSDKTFATIVVKATFQPGPRGTLELATETEPIVGADEHLDQNPTRSVRASSDLAPYLSRGEVFLTGSARSTGGTRGVVRLVVARGSTALVDRRVVVRGDDAPRGQPLVVPLVFENAAGGAGQKQNPVGRAAPLLLDPTDPAGPAAFGPIARTWAARASMLGAAQKKGLSGKVWSVDGVPPEYFHAAPVAQRATAFFAGDEVIYVDGVTANGARIEWRLPGARAEARVLGADGALTPVRLVADTLRVDVEQRRVSLVFRGYFAIEGAQRAVVAAGIAMPGVNLQWPTVEPTEPDATSERAGGPPDSGRKPASMGETALVHMEGLTAPTLPFGATKGRPDPDDRLAPSGPVPGAPWSGSAPPSQPSASAPIPAQTNQAGTFDMPSAKAALAAPRPAPVAPPAPIAVAPVAPKPVVVVRLAEVAGKLPPSTIHLPPGLGSELLYALRDELSKGGR